MRRILCSHRSCSRAGSGKIRVSAFFLSKEILGITGITIGETGEPGNGARFEIRVPKGAFRMTEN